MKLRAFVAGGLGAGMLLCGIAVARGAAPQTAGNPPFDMSGMWLVNDPGSGDWTSFYENVPKPKLQPRIVEENLEEKASEEAGNVVNTTPHTADCPVGDLPMSMASSGPLNITQSKDEIIVGKESASGRVIYMDGRPHPKAGDVYIPSGWGHSVGHWEGDTLVVDTANFVDHLCDSRRPVMRTPGGGRVKDTTHLTERWKVINGGKTLSVTLTWEDPTVFLAPFTYGYTYNLIPNALPEEGGNDLSDAAYLQRQRTSVIPPKQN